MRIPKIAMLAILGIGAYYFLNKTSTASAMTSGGQVTTPVASSVTLQSTPTSYTRTTGVYAPELTGQAASKLAKLVADPHTQTVLATENPLTYISVDYTGATKQSSVGGKGASDEARKAARKENAKLIASQDPSYKQTLSYQKIMSS